MELSPKLLALVASLVSTAALAQSVTYRLKAEKVSSTCKVDRQALIKDMALNSAMLTGKEQDGTYVLSDPNFDIVFKKVGDAYVRTWKSEEHAFSIQNAKTAGAKVTLSVETKMKVDHGKSFEEVITMTVSGCTGKNCSGPAQPDDLISVGGPCVAVYKLIGTALPPPAPRR